MSPSRPRNRLRSVPRLLTLALLGALSAAGAASAWGPTGHRVVGQIAADHLGEAARREVAALLGQSLAEASTWADDVRDDPEWKRLDPYHYVNLDPARGRFARCPDRGCVVDGIRDAVAILGDQTMAREERATALRLLIHFAGDLHQPLHVSHREDRGGNDVAVAWFGEPSNLHWVWDTGIVREALGRRWSSIAGELERRIANSELGDPDTWRAGDVVDWTHETYRLSVEVVYPSSPPGARLGREYAREHRRLVETQLAKAGVRLAALIESALR
jgi:hypothetical protein